MTSNRINVPKDLSTDALIELSRYLRECKELWKRMEIEPDTVEGDGSFGDKHVIMKLINPNSKYPCACPICQFVMRECHIGIPRDCIPYCPLSSLWPDGCIDRDSPYKMFERQHGTSEGAKQIWKEADRVLRAVEKRIKRRQVNETDI